METLRHKLLQAELAKIEQEAEDKSVAIMNKIDALVLATELCSKINEGITCGVRFDPTVAYYWNRTIGINIYTGRDGDVMMARLGDLGIAWNDCGISLDDQHCVEIDGVPGVTVFVRNVFLAAAAKRELPELLKSQAA